MMQQELNIPRQDETKPEISAFRDKILHDLQKALKPIANCLINDTFTYENADLPIIIIRDNSDEIQAQGETLKHELSISVDVITRFIDSELNKAVLGVIRDFKSSFNASELVGINREFETGENNSLKTEFELKFLYYTELWSY